MRILVTAIHVNNRNKYKMMALDFDARIPTTPILLQYVSVRVCFCPCVAKWFIRLLYAESVHSLHKIENRKKIKRSSSSSGEHKDMATIWLNYGKLAQHPVAGYKTHILKSNQSNNETAMWATNTNNCIQRHKCVLR